MTLSNNTNVNGNGNNHIGQFGDTTLTKVFVGGLAWETPKEAMRDHFQKYGEILEAVIISDKLTGRSKGYGFVTFKEPEAAKKACEEATPIINAASPPPATPFHRQQHPHQHAAVPKLSYNGGAYMGGGHYSQVYPGVMSANTLMPMYPMYHYHQAHTMGPSAHMFATTTGPISAVPAIISKPPSITAPNSVCLTVE
ncbi:hypothetical protein G4B88_011573 [Cannabis sativa]|uniref:RRM domain-containing protein n=1 Tax=Cannabis sativa TaxID=3483 RepID=A0A7J6GH61_CANSA|nr:hypothetical protein G4B88_011573 [Cannabis sativa]